MLKSNRLLGTVANDRAKNSLTVAGAAPALRCDCTPRTGFPFHPLSAELGGTPEPRDSNVDVRSVQSDICAKRTSRALILSFPQYSDITNVRPEECMKETISAIYYELVGKKLRLSITWQHFLNILLTLRLRRFMFGAAGCQMSWIQGADICLSVGTISGCPHASGLLFNNLIELRHSAVRPFIRGRFITNEQPQ